MSFLTDIQGKNTQLFPVVEIDGLWYSTNNVTVDGNYCKPILINIPSIKESVDIESRKFKISNVSLQFNNFPFDGVRFSDQLSESSLINTEVSIYFKSPSTNTVADMQEVYQGIIRRISHDDTKVKIELEDLTEKKAHKDLPQQLDQNGVVGYLGGGDGIPDKYKNKPIPMVYGEVDRSPCVISFFEEAEGLGDLAGTYSFKVLSEYRDISDLMTDDSSGTIGMPDEHSHIYINENEKYFPIKNTKVDGVNTLKSDFEYSESQYDENSDTGEFEFSSMVDGQGEGLNPLGDGYLELFYEQYPNGRTVELIGLSETAPYTDGDYSDIDNFTNTFDNWNESSNGFIWQNANELDTYLHTHQVGRTYVSGSGIVDWRGSRAIYNFESLGISNEDSKVFLLGQGKLVNYNVTVYDSDASTSSYTTETDEKLYVRGTSELTLLDTVNCIIPSSDSYGTYRFVSLSRGLWDTDKFSLNMGTDDSLSILISNRNQSQGYNVLRWTVHAISLSHSIKIKSPTSKDFFANVKGRINTFDDHPEFNEEVFIENPIDIIYDLVRKELGHDAIDEDEYAEAKAAHDGWKFGFTVNKKINSKKLIEEIAKSTKCFPKFKNDGTFGFNTIKNSYTVSDIVDGVEKGDYNTATLIKESEVISYSFKKTKPEQIVSEVGIKYKKDYAQDSYLKDVFSYIDQWYHKFDTFGDGSQWEYYGIDDPEDAYLEFESDYIRDDHTAHWLREFLFEHNRNNHLIFNLKLPLQYINLEIGSMVKFRELFNGVKAYGIDYRRIEAPNGQYYYPLFMVTATTKNLDSVSVECMQLHLLWSAKITDEGQELWLEGTGEDDTEGLFYFPDTDPIVIPETPELPTGELYINIMENDLNDINTEAASYHIYLPHASAGEYTYTENDGTVGHDYTDLITIETSLGQTFTGSDVNNPHSMGSVDSDTQAWALYKVTSPLTMNTIEEFLTININVDAAPSLVISPMTNNFILNDDDPLNPMDYDVIFHHILQLEDVEGIDYREKYIYNTSPDQQINYSATDETGDDLTNSVIFGADLGAMLNGESPLAPNIHSAAESYFMQFGGETTFLFSIWAVVMDSAGTYSNKKWKVAIERGGFSPPDGDVNFDGALNILDIVTMVNYIMGNIIPTEAELAASDLSGDGGLNVLDIVQAVNIIMND